MLAAQAVADQTWKGPAMSATGFSSFDTTVEKTNHILHEIEQAYGWPKDRRIQSYAALRTILHALRDRLTVQVTAQLAAQLPTLVRGIYYDGWNPSAVPMKMDREEFLARVREEFRYSIDGDIPQLVDTVLQALRNHVTQSEWDGMKSTLPKDLATALP
jgi:uncharacterized protein (DUF2267 family)